MEEFLNEILEIIRSNKSNEEKRQALSQYHDNDIADVLNKLEDQEKIALVKILGKERLSEIIAYLDNSEAFLDLLKDEEAADVIELMDADDAVDILEDLDDEDRNKIIELLNEDAKEDVKLILSFDKDQVGSLMTTNYIVVKKGDGVKGSMKKLIDQAKENDNFSTLIVLDDNDKFYGCLDLKHLIIARDGDNLTEKVQTNYPYVYAEDLIDDVINDLKDYAEDIIPVLDKENKLLGVITSSDIVELVEKEAAEDYNRLAGLTKQEDEEETLFGSIKKRIPWLVLLLFLGLFVSSIISIFSEVIASVTAAVLFQSVVFDMAGNGGTQSLAVTITKITQNSEIDKKRFGKMFLKEVSIGLINGLILGTISFCVVLAFLVIRHQGVVIGGNYDFSAGLLIGSSVGISLMIWITLSSILGLILPIFFEKIKIDPAVASGPMITTINDICSSCIYYTLIGILFGILF